MILLAALYTLCCFRYFTTNDEERREDYCGLEHKMILLLHFLAFCVLYFRTENELLLPFYAAQLAFFIAYPFLLSRLYRNISRQLVNNVCFFLALGMIMLTRLDLSDAVRQFVIVLISSLLTLPVPLVVDKIWKLSDLRWVYAAAGLGLLLCVFLFGSTSYGAKVSIGRGGFSVQPSEFVKLLFVFFAASMFYHVRGFHGVLITSLAAAAHVVVLILCKDLGTALLFFVTYIVMLYVATRQFRWMLFGSAAVAAASMIAYQLFAHVRNRVAAWENPFSDVAGVGYQMAHSLFAIGTGGLMGLGLDMGMPDRIPIVEKDFIFSAISEELGAVTAVCLILVCLCCFLQMMMIATYMDHLFYKLAASGLAMLYIMQVFLTVGGAVKFIPSTGVTLPFVAYGGSSILSSFLLFMTVQGMYVFMLNEADAADEAASSGGAYGEAE